MLPVPTVYLVGFMGSGKTTIGRLLSASMKRPFIDLDAVIEKDQGQTVAKLFEKLGEASFRMLEREALLRCTVGPVALVATGGGAPCYLDNMRVMNAHGVTLYLYTSPLKLATRLSGGQAKRPLLKGISATDLPSHIETLLNARAPYYNQATYRVTTDGLSDEAVLQACLTILSGKST